MIKLRKQNAILRFNRVIHKLLNLIHPLSDKPIHYSIEKRFCCHCYKYNIFRLKIETLFGNKKSAPMKERIFYSN